MFLKFQKAPGRFAAGASTLYLSRKGYNGDMTESDTQTSKPSLAGKKIMWIEDDKFLSDIISRKLSHEQCVLIHASDGEGAVSMVETEMPDVILLDILLPGIDGFEVLSRLKANPKIKNIPVIMLSNLGQKGDVDKGQSLGATCFLVKATVTLDEIIDEVRSVIFSK